MPTYVGYYSLDLYTFAECCRTDSYLYCSRMAEINVARPGK